MHQIRAFQQSDIGEIEEMVEDVWGGADHLPSLIPNWLEDPDCSPFVIVVQNEICGVGNLHVIDDGATGWMEGLRVRGSKRRRGLGKRMTDRIVQVGKAKGVDRLRLVTAPQNEGLQKLALGAGLAPISRMKVFWRDLKDVDWSYDSLSFRSMNARVFLEFAVDSPDLVPHAAIYRHYDVYDAATANGNLEQLLFDFHL